MNDPLEYRYFKCDLHEKPSCRPARPKTPVGPGRPPLDGTKNRSESAQVQESHRGAGDGDCSCVAGAGSLLCLPVLPRPEPPPRLRNSPPPSSPSKLPAIPGQGGQGQEQSGSRSTPEKAKGAPTMTAPTMAAPTANMANISEAGDTAVHHGESSPAAGRGARTVVHVALQAAPAHTYIHTCPWLRSSRR